MSIDSGPGVAQPRRIPGERCPADIKLAIVLRLLAGETLGELSRETGRPRKQLSVWRRRFLEGGEAALDSRIGMREIDTLRAAKQELLERVTTLEMQNRRLSQRITLLGHSRSGQRAAHPFCSEPYALALEQPGLRSMYVPEWDTYVLVQETVTGLRLATGVQPIASLYSDCDVQGGIDTLRRAGITSVSLITDPLWCPDLPVLQDAFRSCRPFRRSYFIDRETAPVHVRKRHRNIVNRARRTAEIRIVPLAGHLGRWLDLYRGNVASRQIAHPFSPAFYERLAEIAGLLTVAVLVDGKIVTMTLWIRHDDILYFQESASSEAGFEVAATYAAFAHVIENEIDVRYILLGTGADFGDEPADGLAVFKRGFANVTATSYLCRTTNMTAP